MATATASSSSPSHPHLMASSSPRPMPSIRLWPPNPVTRSTLVQRLSGHLSSVSFFSERYGQIGAEEASLHAARIEEEAFQAASQQAAADDSSADLAVVQFYAKEASRLMLECLKRGPLSFSPVSEAVGAIETPAAEADLSALSTFFDISDGNRGFLTKEAAIELLKPLTVPGNTFSGICFSNRSFGEDAAIVAGGILETLRSQLVQVNLADIVASRPEEEALTVMSIFSAALEGCRLKYLNLSDNALGEKGVRAFSELLQSQCNLEELYFINNGISEEAAQAICELLPSSEKLRILHFHNNMTGDGGAIALSELVKGAPVLEDFRCSSTRVATDGGIALADALLAGSSLRKIDLRDNPFGSDVGIALAKPLKQHLDLKEVYLSYLGFEDEGMKAVLEALQEGAPGLQVLELAGNDFTVLSARKLADCIASKTQLTKLNLSENELQDAGVVVVCDALLKGHEGLLELDLSETDIGRIGACAAAQAVAVKPGFKLLSLNGNHISEAGIEALKEVLQKGLHGTSVLGTLEDNDEEDQGDDNEEEDEEDERDDADDELHAQFGKVKV